MSRSIKEPIIKQCPRNVKKSTLYWRTVRRVTKLGVRKLLFNPENEIPNPKIIIGDYGYCDYVFDFRFNENEKRIAKRK